MPLAHRLLGFFMTKALYFDFGVGPLTFDFQAEKASFPILVLNKYSWTKVRIPILLTKLACYANN